MTPRGAVDILQCGSKTIENEFGAWLKARRGQARLSLRALAKTAGVAASTLSYWEAGKSLPRLPELESVFDALAVSAKERQTVLQAMETPRALQRSQSESALYRPAFVEKAGHLPHGGDLLKAMRLRKQWSLQDAARQIGVRQTTLGRWEKAEHFPDAAKLQTVCFVYGASESEMTALTCGRYSLDQTGAAQLSPEALEHRFRTELQPLELTAEAHPGCDLRFLSMEAALWTHALHDERVSPLLAEVYAHHASYLRNWRLDNETYAYRCLELLPRDTQLPGFAALAIVCVNDALLARKTTAHKQLTPWLNHWLTRGIPPHYASWMLRKLSGLLCLQGDFEGARRELRRANALPEHERSEFDRLEVRRYHAMSLLSEGQIGNGLEHLPATPDTYPPNRVRDALIRTRGWLKLNNPREAHEALQAAYEDINLHQLTHWRSDADLLSLRF